jgi:hypothetical protein
LSSATSHVLNGLLGRVPQPLILSSSRGKPQALMWGSFFFGYFLLATQKKETRKEAKNNTELINNIFCTSNALENLLHQVSEHNLLKLQQTEEIE